MPIHKAENVYRGSNAHLHSYFQRGEGWNSFHQSHITDLLRALQKVLPLDSGYVVEAERSLQFVHTDQDTTIQLRPDIGIYQRGDTPHVQSSQPATETPTLTLPARVIDLDPEEVLGIVISRPSDEAIVTRIELLSPANKPPGSNYRAYRARRIETLDNGIHLVEIDYLHERASPIPGVPSYPQREEKAYPYWISISDMRVEQTRVYGLRVDDPIPKLTIPLAGEDSVRVDFGAVYKTTYEGNNRYAGIIVDYEQPPLNFDAYDAEDQNRIKAVMARAAEMG